MAKYLNIVFPMIAALLAVSVVQAQSPTEVEGATTIDVVTAKTLFDRGVPFVDVRGVTFYAGQIPRAVHLSWEGEFTEAKLGEVATKDQEVVIYCGGPACARSSLSSAMAVSWGYKKVYYFRDGYPGWEAAGYPSNFNPDQRSCHSLHTPPDDRIAACTRIIEAERPTPHDLAVVFISRATAHKKKRQLDRAIDDYSQAIRLRPDGHLVARASHNRGNIYRNKGQFDRAIADYDESIRLRPDKALYFTNRGLTHEKNGDEPAALRDFEKAYALGFRHPLLLKKLRKYGALPSAASRD